MGENAKHCGRRIKIGTCVDLYYLRAGQARSVEQVAGSLDPADPRTQRHIRFRFPWPDEDAVPPGGFENFDRGLAVHASPPEDLEHGLVQFKAQPGYLVSLPCPEGPQADRAPKIHRNGFPGNIRVVQQAYRKGVLVVVCACSGCGRKYSLATLEDAQPVIDAVRERGFDVVAGRIVAGYLVAERSSG